MPFHSSRNARPDRIVISGFGCLTPLGNSREELWDGFRNARSGIGRIAAFDPFEFPVQIAGEVRGITEQYRFGPLMYLVITVVAYFSALVSFILCLLLAVFFAIPKRGKLA